MIEIDDTIGKVENLYRSLTGREAPELTKPHAPIPAEADPVEHVQEQMDRLAQLLATTSGRQNQTQTQTWIPPLSVWESADEIHVHIDLPGVKRQAVEVTVQANVLIITGRRTLPATNGTKLQMLHAEHPSGAFKRALPLPPYAKTDQLAATLQDGVLSIRIPRDPAASTTNARQVPIT